MVPRYSQHWRQRWAACPDVYAWRQRLERYDQQHMRRCGALTEVLRISNTLVSTRWAGRHA